MTDVAPPATGEWWDESATVAAVLHTLRLQGGDVDTIRLQSLVPAAGLIINNYMDRVVVIDGPPAPPDLQAALERVVIELYTTTQPTAGNQYMPLDRTYIRALLDSLIPHRRQRRGAA